MWSLHKHEYISDVASRGLATFSRTFQFSIMETCSHKTCAWKNWLNLSVAASLNDLPYDPSYHSHTFSRTEQVLMFILINTKWLKNQHQAWHLVMNMVIGLGVPISPHQHIMTQRFRHCSFHGEIVVCHNVMTAVGFQSNRFRSGLVYLRSNRLPKEPCTGGNINYANSLSLLIRITKRIYVRRNWSW